MEYVIAYRQAVSINRNLRNRVQTINARLATLIRRELEQRERQLLRAHGFRNIPPNLRSNIARMINSQYPASITTSHRPQWSSVSRNKPHRHQ